MNRHAVQLFARYAEMFGADRVEVLLPANARVSDLVAALRDHPGGGSLPERPFVARNMAQAASAEIIEPGDEIALLPPLAGG